MILDADLAALFGVSTGRLNEQIRRNRKRFPEDFAFALTATEAAALRSQIAISKIGRGGRRYLPFALTEHGVVMAANVLKSPHAVAMSVEVVRAFIRLRKAARAQESIRRKLAQLEAAVAGRLDRHDAEIGELFRTVESLIEKNEEAPPERRRIGFVP